jgi:multiple antibiotic resistance protein
MNIDWAFISIVFTGLFAIINPIGNAPIFISLTDGFSKEQQKAVALKAVLVGFCILVVFVLFGYTLFNIFGISIQAFRITGGLLVVKVGFDMITTTPKVKTLAEVNEGNNDMGIAVSPLAMPILIGPGTLSTAINFVGMHRKIESIAIVLLSSAVILAISYFVFISSSTLVKKIGNEALNAITKIMGLLIASIGIQMIITSVEELLKGKL